MNAALWYGVSHRALNVHSVRADSPHKSELTSLNIRARLFIDLEEDHPANVGGIIDAFIMT